MNNLMRKRSLSSRKLKEYLNFLIFNASYFDYFSRVDKGAYSLMESLNAGEDAILWNQKPYLE